MLSEVQKEILKLKEEKNAIILAHNYQPEEIQLIADFIGDSLELCIKSSEIKDKELVVFCGVDFMAETAAILNPDKKIILPEKNAECPMAHMLKSEEVIKQKEKYPNAEVALYVNSLADAKAEADILVTSSNAVKVVESLESNQILFGPDNNLAKFVDNQTDKEIIPIPDGGHCYVHKMFHIGDVAFKKEEHPEAKLIIHPECDKEVQDLADAVLSTGGMINYVKNESGKEFIVGTEVDLITRINREVPEKTTYPLLDDAICKTMKLHTLEKVKNALENDEYVVKVDEQIAEKSLTAIERMIEVSKR